MKKISLHPAQRDVFSDQVLNPKSSHYNIGFCIDFEGWLDKEKFKYAVSTSPEVFDIFKMRFDINEPDFHGYIDEKFELIELFEIDFSNFENPREEAKKFMQNRHNTPFEIKIENLLFEFYLIKISNDHYWFFIRFHHLIIDGFGVIIWINYISKKYRYLLKDEQISLTYPSFFEEIKRSDQFYNSLAYAESGRYWKNKIKEKPQNLFHKKYLQSIDHNKKSANYFLNISESKKKLFKELAITTNSSLQQLTTAALLIYFGKTSMETEFTFGIPHHKRNSEREKNTVGMFSGILPFKLVYKEGETLMELLEDIRISRREDYPHRNYLASDLSRSLRMSIADSNLSDIVINYVPFEFDLNYGDQLKASILRVPGENERIPLQLFWRDYGKDLPLVLGMHYNLEYFKQEEIELLTERMIYILEQFPDALKKNIGNIDIVPTAEKQVLERFNTTTFKNLQVPANGTIVSEFEEQVKRHPDLVAVSFENCTCTYEELNKRANKLANYLRVKGVTIETFVSICIERGIEMIVGIMGILKAGGVYVPVDPEHPEERIRDILDDLGSSIIICSQSSKTKISNFKCIELILIDTEWPLINTLSSKVLDVSIIPENLAYVIYTSGSTGKPKGVMIEHKSYLNINNQYHKISPGEQTILTCNYVFDVSVLEIFSSLLSGGCLNIPPSSIVTNPAAFAEYLQEKKISTAYIHPMFLDEVAGTLAQHKHYYLTKILIGVEPIRKESVKWYLNQGTSILNGYGPTETTICSTFFEVNKEGDTRQVLPIGKPLEGVQIFIANHSELAPIGIAGEILIGGVGLARGYVNGTGITSEKFVDNIFNKDSSSRLYRTGDLGKWMPDGNLEYLGRIDNQIKVSGYRIEPAEIENTLMQSKFLKQCIVVVKEYEAGDKRLVAYVVSEQLFDTEAVVAYLSKKLPHYMIPVHWVEMGSLPRTSSGKIDRNALPEPDIMNIKITEFIAPGNQLEIKLAAMWKKLLYVEKVSVNENFFQIGGHSLLAVHLINLIFRETGKKLQVSDLLENPTIEKLAKIIGNETKAYNYQFLVSIKTDGEKIPLYMVCGPGGTALTFYKFASSLDPFQPVYALQLTETLLEKQAYPNRSLEDVAAKFVEEISIQNPTGPYALSGHCMGGIIAFEMAKQLKLKGKVVKILAMFDSIIPNDEHTYLLNTSNKLNYKTRIKETLDKVYSKLDLEMYLLKNHPQHAIDYKINSIKSAIKKVLRYNRPENNSYAFKEKSKQEFKKILYNYKLSNYNGHILIFYAKDHYKFADKNRNIFYKRIPVEDNIKNRWKDYASSVKIYELDGEHSTFFEDKDALKFATILQEHLNTCSK